MLVYGWHANITSSRNTTSSDVVPEACRVGGGAYWKRNTESVLASCRKEWSATIGEYSKKVFSLVSLRMCMHLDFLIVSISKM